jgi:hypothetical protein
MLERLNAEVKQRTYGVRIFPNAESRAWRAALHRDPRIGLLERFHQLQEKAHERTGLNLPIVVIHACCRRKEPNATSSTSRRRRRADSVDGVALIRTLLASRRGEPRVAEYMTSGALSC